MTLGGEGSEQFEFAKYFTDSNAIEKSETTHTCVCACPALYREKHIWD